MVTDTDILIKALQKLVVNQFRKPIYIKWVCRRNEWAFSVTGIETFGVLDIVWNSPAIPYGGVMISKIYGNKMVTQTVPWAEPKCDTIIAKAICDWFEEIKLR